MPTTLIAYYSWSGNTEEVAEKMLHELPNCEGFEIQVADGVFSKDMYTTSDIAKKQVAEQAFPEILGAAPKKNYDYILVGAPIWNNAPATPVYSFLKKLGHYDGKLAFFYTSVGQDSNAGSTFAKWARACCGKDVKIDRSYPNDEGLHYWF